MTRRRSLAGRLSRALAACVALALIVMVAASTLVMRSWMLGNMDSELHRLAQRAGEHLDVDDAPDPKVEGGDADASADGETIDYVIVHKLDRLARNRADDVEINRAFDEAGVRLVSTSENIDQTPGGMLLHGIMSSIAEFYSRNLANEVIKGMGEKARNGGAIGRAPLGYLNKARPRQAGQASPLGRRRPCPRPTDHSGFHRVRHRPLDTVHPH